jgi:hypothetical protein
MNIPGTARPPALTRLCVLSFINQGLVFPLYLLGFLASFPVRDADPQVMRDTAEAIYKGWFDEQQMEQLFRFLDTLREHGVALMGVFALRTAARFVGTLRMWRLKGDGFHIYTVAQLLGVLLPMLIAGTDTFNPLGLLAAALWCLMYFVRMRSIGALGSGLGNG